MSEKEWLRSLRARNGSTCRVWAERPSSGLELESQTRLQGSLKGEGRTSTVRRTLKTVVLAPMPRAMMRTAKTVKPGSRRIIRKRVAEVLREVFEKGERAIIAL